MYESPINIIFQDIETRIIQRNEQMMFEAIQKQDVFVDKEELIKAINYDRNQYSKGYKDGVSEVLDNVKAEIDGLLNDEDSNMYTHGVMDCLEIIDKFMAESEET